MRVTEAPARGMIAVKGDLADDVLREVVCGVAGTGFPEAGEALLAGDGALLWMAPDEVLVICGSGERSGALARLSAMAEGRHVLVEDVSDMRAAFVLEGDAVRDVLARVTAADVSPGALPPGRIRRTRVGQVAAAVWLTGEGRAEVVCFRSVGAYMRALLDDAATSEPLGLHSR